MSDFEFLLSVILRSGATKNLFLLLPQRETHICHLERSGQIFHFSDNQERFLAFGSK